MSKAGQVAKSAAETHKAIKQVNKWPEKSRAEKDAKANEISRLKDQWKDNKHLFAKEKQRKMGNRK